MLLAERTLNYGTEGLEEPVNVRIYVPQAEDADWSCSFDIAWPDRTLSKTIYGLDAIQALNIALQMIGLLLYSSHEHRTGNLFWQKRGDGYGFPVPNTDLDLLIGTDKRYFGSA